MDASQATPNPGQEKAAPNPEAGEAKEGAAAPKSAAEKAALAKAAAAAKAAAKKEESGAKPLVDNGDGTLTDPGNGLMWKKSDAWLDTKRFYKWADHKSYVDENNKKKFAGHGDWRIPTKAEAATLVDKTKQNLDKNGTIVPIDPLFQSGCAASTWISECSNDKITRFDLKNGVETVYPTTDIWSSIWLVRKPK